MLSWLRSRALFWVTCPLWLALDLATKEWALRTLAAHDRVIHVVPGFFHLKFSGNRGVAFGLLQEVPHLLPALTMILLLWLAWFATYLDWNRRTTQFAVALIVAGAVGNLVDRLRHGYVVDFLDFWFWGWNYPTFNVADSGLCVGLGLILLTDAFREKA